MVKKAIIYCRVATAEGELKDNESIKHQESICVEYARKKGYRVLDTVKEQGSGLTINKGLAICIKKVFKNQADVLIAAEPSRVTRSFNIFLKIKQILGSRLEFLSSAGQKDLVKRDFMDAMFLSVIEYGKSKKTARPD